MILSPEGGGGCSCGSWLEASLAFAPTPVPPPMFSTSSDALDRSIQVTLASSVRGAAIHYTLDGSDPTPESPQYRVLITLRQNATVAARTILYRNGGGAPRMSEVVRQTFKIP
jgi:hypothetical protein